MAASRATMPIISEIRDRRPNLLGQICDGRVRKLAGSPTKAAGRALELQLQGKAEFGIGRFGIQKRHVFKAKAPSRGKGPVRVQSA